MLPTPTKPTVEGRTVLAPPTLVAKPSTPSHRPHRSCNGRPWNTVGYRIIMYVQILGVKHPWFLGVISAGRLEAAAQLDAVGVAVWMVVGDREFDGGLAGVEVQALYAQARLAGRAPDHAGHIGG